MSEHYALNQQPSENAAANPRAQPTVVLGLGNAIMGDDGAGLLALEALQAMQFSPEVRFVYGGVWGLALLGDVESAGSLLLLDAVHADAPPGAVVVLEGEAIPRFLSMKLSPHQVDVRELLALATLRGALPHRMALVGVQVAQVDLSTDLSPEVRGGHPGHVRARRRAAGGLGTHARHLGAMQSRLDPSNMTRPGQAESSRSAMPARRA